VNDRSNMTKLLSSLWLSMLLLVSMVWSHHTFAAQKIVTAIATAEKKPQVLLPILGANAIRGVWVPTPNHTDFWNSRALIESHLDGLKATGINAVFLVVWNQGRTFYPSRIMKNFTGVEIDERLVGRDPLREVIDAAKPRGIKVFVWFEFGFATDINDGKGREILLKKPHWSALKKDGKQVIRNGIRWMNAFDPEVQDFMLSLWMEVVDNYEVDGLQGDDRLPALPVEGGYDPLTVSLYRRAHDGRNPPDNHKDAAWIQWRADILNRYMQRIFVETKKRKPSIIVSMAPSIYPWCRDEFLQDWPMWVNNGWVELVTPQVYRKDVVLYENIIRDMSQKHIRPQFHHIVFPGLLTRLSDGYQAEAPLLKQMVEVNRKYGFGGEVYFFNEGVRRIEKVIAAMYDVAAKK
jgi:uncharacterized lipoprotein YddW (UPF0748 family)